MQVLDSFLSKVETQIINPIILLLIACAFVVFTWGVFKFIQGAGDETTREEGKQAMFWSIIGFVVIFGAYGILNFALGTFGLDPVR
jgi:uncharacterized membrane protein